MTAKNFSITALNWIKPDLDDLLNQSKNALQEYVEGSQETQSLRQCIQLLHQAQATLGMVEIQSAALLALELECLAKAILSKDIEEENRPIAFNALIEGIVQLPDYLDRLKVGHKDVPIVLLPLLNQLRELRHEKKISESALFLPSLNYDLPKDIRSSVSYSDNANLKSRADYMRTLFQGYLLRWLKNDEPQEALECLTDVCDQLTCLVINPHARRFFWIAAGCFDALAHNQMNLHTPLKHALAKVEKEIKRLATEGEEGFKKDPPLDVTRQLLYFVAHDIIQPITPDSRIFKVFEAFALSDVLTTEEERKHAQSSLAGHNHALLHTVSVALKEDLLKVKDSLDLHLRAKNTKSDLGDDIKSLYQIGLTLGMIGLTPAQEDIWKQKERLTQLVSMDHSWEYHEDALLDVAASVLGVEARLDAEVNTMGAGGSGLNPDQRQLLDALIKEASVNFSKARQCVVMFIETQWDHSRLDEVPKYLAEVSGALQILDVPEPALHFAAVGQYVTQELLTERKIPTAQDVNALADAMTGLEYFLEALQDRQPALNKILQTTQSSLEQLGYWPPKSGVPSVPAPVEFTEQDIAQVVSGLNLSPVSIAPVIDPVLTAPIKQEPAPQPVLDLSPPQAPVPDADGLIQVNGFGASGVEIDSDIRDIFIEEIDEELATLPAFMSAWRQEMSKVELAKPLRKSFHTLKGSGRLVGAVEVGELSWKIESLLNRVLDGTRPPTLSVVKVVQVAADHIAQFKKALEGQVVRMDLPGLLDTIDRISQGEELTYAPPSARVSPPAPTPQTDAERAQAQKDLDVAAQRAKEALLASEAAAKEQERLREEEEKLRQASHQAQLDALQKQLDEEQRQREEDEKNEELLMLQEQLQQEQAEHEAQLAQQKAQAQHDEQRKQEQERLREEELAQLLATQEKAAREEADRLAQEQEAERLRALAHAQEQERMREEELRAQALREQEALEQARLEEERAHAEMLAKLEAEEKILQDARLREEEEHAKALALIQESENIARLQKEEELELQAQRQREIDEELARQEEALRRLEDNQRLEAELELARQQKKEREQNEEEERIQRQLQLEEQERLELASQRTRLNDHFVPASNIGASGEEPAPEPATTSLIHVQALQDKTKHLASRLAAFRSGLSDLQDLAQDNLDPEMAQSPEEIAATLHQFHNGFDRLLKECEHTVAEQKSIHKLLSMSLEAETKAHHQELAKAQTPPPPRPEPIQQAPLVIQPRPQAPPPSLFQRIKAKLGF